MTSSAKWDFSSQKNLIFLAPMEGVVDPLLRETLTELRGIDICTTEFVRVTQHLLSDETFYKYAPELKNQSRTSSGTPVFVQILGSDLGAYKKMQSKQLA